MYAILMCMHVHGGACPWGFPYCGSVCMLARAVNTFTLCSHTSELWDYGDTIAIGDVVKL